MYSSGKEESSDYEKLLKQYKELEKKLEEKEYKLKFYETMVDELPVPIFAKDGDAKYSILNKAFEEFFEISKENYINKTVLDFDFLNDEERNEYSNSDLDLIESLDCLHFERDFNVNSKIMNVLYWKKGFSIDGSSRKGIAGVLLDTSKEKEFQNSLLSKNKRIESEKNIIQNRLKHIEKKWEATQTILDIMPFVIEIWSPKNEFLDCSQELLRILGLSSKEEFIDNMDKYTPEFQPNGQKSFDYINDTIKKTLKDKSCTIQWNYLSKSGEIIHFEGITISGFMHEEEVIFACFKDMREHYANVEKIREVDEYNKMMLDSNPFGTAIFDSSFKLHYCNKALAATFGFEEPQEFMDNFYELIPELQPNGKNTWELLSTSFQKALEMGKTEKERFIGKTPQGEAIPMEIYSIRIKNNDEYMVVSYVKDLRDIEKNIDKLEKTEAYNRILFDKSPLVAHLFDKNLRLIDFNERVIDFFDISSKQEYLENFFKFSPEYQPDGILSSEHIRKNLDKVMEDGYLKAEWMHQKLNGEPIPAEFIMIKANVDDKDVALVYLRDLREEKAMIKELKDIEDDLREAKNIAEQSSKAKSEFLANMSHEIRTPMNGILGLLHILSTTQLNSMQKDYIEKTLFSANELLRILNDILDFSKIEAGKLQMEEIAFNVHDVCSEVQSLFGENLRSKNLVFYLNECEFSTINVIGDPLRLKQVLLNLIGNAIKFTKQGSITLNIQTKKVDNKLHFTFEVKDSGIGISKEEIKNLFAPFVQADSSVTRKYGGTGLGLPICKSIVEMMDGKIWIESEVGKGSSFFFTTIFEILEEDTKTLTSNEVTKYEHRVRDEKILLVEDNNINQLIAKELLKKVGYSVFVAENGQIAIDMLEKDNYDLVLMDIQMPVMDGLTATLKIRENEKFKDLPIIAMSAHAMQGDREKSIEYGMNEHITKPIAPETLYETLDFWLSKNK